MKMLSKNANWLMLLLVLFGLSSCEVDPDSDKGYKLSGKWFGDLGMYVGNEPARGSVIEFIPENYDYTEGWGREVDYYGPGGRYTVEHIFDWYIDRGVIVLVFDNPSLNCSIIDYSLSSRYFRGYLNGIYSSTRFELKSYSKYWGDSGYGPYYSKDNYVKENAQAIDSAKVENPVCVRKVNVSADVTK